jgi:phosphatidylglycerophosphate synthase
MTDDPRNCDSTNAGTTSRELPASEWNYFAAGEQELQSRFRQRRDQWLAPVVRVCQTSGLSADVISGWAIAMLLPFGLALFLRLGGWSPLVAVAALAAHVLLDGLDGPVARAAGTAGPAGAFTDMALDHTGYLIVTTLLTAAGLVEGWAACAYVSTYTLAVVMVVMLNLLQRPLAYVVRTKYVFYLLVALQQFGGANLLSESAAAFSAVHALFAAVGFAAVRRGLRG